MYQAMKRPLVIVLAVLAVLLATAALEIWMGRTPFGPDDRFGFWEGDIKSSAQSQRVADPYSFSHVVHGLAFYGLLWLCARGLPQRHRCFLAVLIESAWEVLENSPFIIQRYRAATIALGYEGDSVLNSMSDIVMMSLGFWFASKARPWMSAAAVIALEAGMLLLMRDNLTLNIIMLIRPIEAIKAWQMAGFPSQ
jgi:hypothetical protein